MFFVASVSVCLVLICNDHVEPSLFGGVLTVRFKPCTSLVWSLLGETKGPGEQRTKGLRVSGIFVSIFFPVILDCFCTNQCCPGSLDFCPASPLKSVSHFNLCLGSCFEDLALKLVSQSHLLGYSLKPLCVCVCRTTFV